MSWHPVPASAASACACARSRATPHSPQACRLYVSVSVCPVVSLCVSVCVSVSLRLCALVCVDLCLSPSVRCAATTPTPLPPAVSVTFTRDHGSHVSG
eukprot:943944-Rhodomonas_salina.2